MIDVRGLTFTYAAADRPAISDLAFHIDEGEIFGFLGPSGAGKSTTQKILIGLLREYVGEITVFGRNLSDWGPEFYERVGVSFEHPNHYLKLTAIENLRYFASLYQGATETPAHVLEQVGLARHRDMRVGEFSKGMQNRLNVARSLLNKPDLLFLDEPTAGLDPVNAQRVRDLIGDLRDRGTTVFLTTHDMWTADQLCNRIAFIIEGGIRHVDSPRHLKMRHGRRSVRVEYRPPSATAPARPTPSGAASVSAAEKAAQSTAEFPLDGLADNRAFLELLRNHEVETIHTLEATLEDVFIELTGRALT